jgi:hypothetical protein
VELVIQLPYCCPAITSDAMDFEGMEGFGNNRTFDSAGIVDNVAKEIFM